MALAQMQDCLSELYGLELGYQVDDFLITDDAVACALGGAKRPTDEELLIAEGEGEAAVSLYLRKELVERLRRDVPTEALHRDNLSDFWTACEGVSHFTYFAYKANSNQSVTLLEMELQAEVDKFVTTLLLLLQQGETPPRSLHRQLFDSPRFAAELDADELERYGHANYYAARYCQRLWPKLVKRVWHEELISELRWFYRLPREKKVRHIKAAH